MGGGRRRLCALPFRFQGFQHGVQFVVVRAEFLQLLLVHDLNRRPRFLQRDNEVVQTLALQAQSLFHLGQGFFLIA